MNNRILFIGPINVGKYPQGGDQYKNQLLTVELQKLHDLKIIDTVNWKKNPFLWLNLIVNLIFHYQYHQIILSASTSSAIRILRLSNKIPQLIHKFNYWVIGGKLHTELIKKPKLQSILNSCRLIIVETQLMNTSLIEQGITKSIQVPNFKDFELKNLEDRKITEFSSVPLKLVFISRICLEKGVELIFEAVKKFNQNQIKVDFFGPIQKNYESQFYTLLSKNSFIDYKGNLNLQDEKEMSYKILSNYDILIFPTYWESEGHPGVLIDAMISGLAVIASNWNSNSEFISGNGQLIRSKNYQDLSDAIEFYIKYPENLIDHKKKSKELAKQYHISKIAPQYLNSLN